MDPFSSKPSGRGEELTVTSWGKYCCGPRHSFDVNTTVVKLNSPCASWEVLDSYSTSVCCWCKEPTNSLKTEIYFLKKEKKYMSTIQSDAKLLSQNISTRVVVSILRFIPWTPEPKSGQRTFSDYSSLLHLNFLFYDISPTLWWSLWGWNSSKHTTPVV